MPAAQHNFVIEQGATFSRVLIIKTSGGVPIVLTGNTIRGQIRSRTSDADALATFTCTLSDQDTAPGEVTISLTAAETTALNAGPQISARRKLAEYAYDIERVSGSTVYRLLEGIVQVSPEATK